jgi:succinate-semialdehyde dehydrogenase/glutarate-semialdehyde dehydrogenase
MVIQQLLVRAAWVNINESSNYWETHLPFGGGGGSATGVGRVGGRYAMQALSQVRTVVLSGLALAPAVDH